MEKVNSIILQLVAIAMLLQHCSQLASAAQVPAMWVFGDSIVDDGNNNYLSSLAKANYRPYGVDFFQGPTGRFTNGKTVADFLGQLLGLPYIPAFSDPGSRGEGILRGVNYASAAAGILEETGRNYGDRFSLSQQVLNFESNLNDLRSIMGTANLGPYLAESMVMMVFGSNDYLNNYLMPSLYSSSYNYTPQQFADLLLNHYSRQLVALHSLGLRKFLLPGVGPLGCIPNQRVKAPPGRCLDSVNQLIGPFNVGLRSLVQQLNDKFPGAIFVYGNTYAALGDMLNNPATYRFSTIDRGCCGVRMDPGEITCLPFSIPCPNRNEYLFWDAFHLTQAANTIIAQRAFTGPPNDCYPINVQQMAQL